MKKLTTANIDRIMRKALKNIDKKRIITSDQIKPHMLVMPVVEAKCDSGWVFFMGPRGHLVVQTGKDRDGFHGDFSVDHNHWISNDSCNRLWVVLENACMISEEARYSSSKNHPF